MWVVPKHEWGAYENAAPVERLDLPGDVRRWTGVRTGAELVPVEARGRAPAPERPGRTPASRTNRR